MLERVTFVTTTGTGPSRRAATASAPAAPATALIGDRDRVPGMPYRIPRHGRDKQKENDPDQPAFLRFTGARRNWFVFAGELR